MRSRDKVFPFFSGRLASASRSGVKEVRNGVRHYLLHYLSCPNTSPPNPRTQEQHSNQSQSPLLQALENQSQPSTSARPSGWQLPEKQSSIYDLKWNTLSSPVLTGPRAEKCKAGLPSRATTNRRALPGVLRQCLKWESLNCWTLSLAASYEGEIRTTEPIT